jgi:DNA-binding NarL/FixJ family response regulator
VASKTLVPSDFQVLVIRSVSAASRKFLWLIFLLSRRTVRPPSQIHGEFIFGSANDKASGKIRCILVHNHVLVRQGLRRLLEDEAELEVVAEAGTASEALERVLKYKPDIVLADSTTMELPADDVEQTILRESPKTRVLFLGVSEEPEGRQTGESTQTDSSCIRPHTSAKELVAMVKGLTDMSRNQVEEVVPMSDREWFRGDVPTAKKRSLTTREREVLKLLAEGQTVRSAAGVLGVSAKTVDAHKFNLMRKLGIHNKAELVMWAIQKKVVKVPVNF